MKRFGLSILMLFILVFSACTDQRQQKIDLITGEEKQYFEQMTQPISTETVDRLVQLYAAFAADYPNDSLTPIYLFKEADLLMNTSRGLEAIQVLDTLIEKYDDPVLIPQAMHMKAFIYDDKLHRYEMARICYEALITKYPEHELSKNAEQYLPLIGLSDEELTKFFMEKNAPKDSI